MLTRKPGRDETRQKTELSRLEAKRDIIIRVGKTHVFFLKTRVLGFFRPKFNTKHIKLGCFLSILGFWAENSLFAWQKMLIIISTSDGTRPSTRPVIGYLHLQYSSQKYEVGV